MYSRRILNNLVRKYNTIFLRNKKQQGGLYIHPKTLSLPTFPNVTFYSSNALSKCWNCQCTYEATLFCSNCKVLQEPAENLTYFDIIGVPHNYNVVLTEIHTKYKELQKQLHPDKFSNKSEKEQEISEQLSSLVNKAFTTLTHPLKRGLYMLKLNGVSVPEGTTNLDPKFLMEIMEKNEEIEAAEQDTNNIMKLVDENKEILDALAKEVAEAFDQGDVNKAKTILIKMRYYDSIYIRLRKLKHDLGIVH